MKDPRDEAVKAASDWETVEEQEALQVLGDEYAEEDVEDVGSDYSTENRG